MHLSTVWMAGEISCEMAIKAFTVTVFFNKFFSKSVVATWWIEREPFAKAFK